MSSRISHDAASGDRSRRTQRALRDREAAKGSRRAREEAGYQALTLVSIESGLLPPQQLVTLLLSFTATRRT